MSTTNQKKTCSETCQSMPICKDDEDGKELCDFNHRIISLLNALKEQRDEIIDLIKRQEEEKQKLKIQMELITYKVTMITKSLQQRYYAKEKYDQTISEVEKGYRQIVYSSGLLLKSCQHNADLLEQGMDKRVGTENGRIPSQLIVEITLKEELPPTPISSESFSEDTVPPTVYNKAELPTKDEESTSYESEFSSHSSQEVEHVEPILKVKPKPVISNTRPSSQKPSTTMIPASGRPPSQTQQPTLQTQQPTSQVQQPTSQTEQPTAQSQPEREISVIPKGSKEPIKEDSKALQEDSKMTRETSGTNKGDQSQTGID